MRLGDDFKCLVIAESLFSTTTMLLGKVTGMLSGRLFSSCHEATFSRLLWRKLSSDGLVLDGLGGRPLGLFSGSLSGDTPRG